MDFADLLKAIVLGIVEGFDGVRPCLIDGYMILIDDMLSSRSEEFLTKYVANTFRSSFSLLR